MSIKIALAGNPNCGKTTLFNALTGSNQYVGNWPGVTVEKKEGRLKQNNDVIVVDLPGIYSLSPYTLEEVVARRFLIEERPDVILNIIDGTNLERNLYLTTQLTEIGIPIVAAINMMDIVRKNGDEINFEVLSKKFGCQMLEISALKGTGITEAAEAAIKAAEGGSTIPQHRFSGEVEHALAHIEEATVHSLPDEQQRWYAIKLFERDEKVRQKLKLPQEIIGHIEEDIRHVEKEFDDDAEGIITSERYDYIAGVLAHCYKKKNIGGLTLSDKIDKVLTNRFLALPIFALIMFLVYYISVVTVGTWATDWANDGVFGEGWSLFGLNIPGIPVLVDALLQKLSVTPWLHSLIIDGMIGGVGAVLGFVPQLLVLFFFLAFLEGCGYMSRIAFVMDRIFRKFGLSGRSFIPLLVGTGCGVPGIMSTRTIENERDRRMTIITTTFIPCSAKIPIIGLIAGALFGRSPWIAPSAYFIGIFAVVISGLILKKTRLFTGEVSPFVMELPAYHMPTISNILRTTWERAWSFIKKAGTIILLSTVVLWALQNFGFENGKFGMVEDLNASILATIGNMFAWIFIPLGFGNWQSAVATATGLIAKENVLSTFGVLFGAGELASANGEEIWTAMRTLFTPVSAYAFLVFNLLCAPCFAAMGAISREMNSGKWTAFAIGYQCLFAYAIALMINQFGLLFTGNVNIFGLIAAVAVLTAMIYLIVRKPAENQLRKGVTV
ncbi:MAG: ferrous iron transport protein B [Oscillospiraceae bacterium]|nr:ferrous iron transport protein B [Oscillospiraceae bacterium]MDD6146884.1 ferrous iron transport protein B [Oscillospiraceae bacterium]